MLSTTSFWQLLRRHWCQTEHFRCSFGSISDVERGTCYMGNSQSSIYHRPGIHPNLHHTEKKTTLQPGEDTPASPYGVDTTRGATVTGYKPSRDWRKARRQGLLPTVGRILASHWTAIARLKLGSPPDRKVLSRHGLLSLLGAWGL